ncbi:hypothetical protein TrRE_jg12669, partial [Triparma retinervis]
KLSPPPPTPATHGYGLLVVLTCMMVAIPFYWGSLEGGEGVDSLNRLLTKLIAYFFVTLILTVSSMLYLISLVSRITYTKAWTSSAFGERYPKVKTCHAFLACITTFALSWFVVFTVQDWGYTEQTHGGLNALGLFAIGGGIILLFFPVAILPTFKQRAGMLVIYALVIGIFFAVSIPIAVREYPKGVNGRMQSFEQQGNCKARNPIPWLGLAPFRLNFIFSGTECDGEGEESYKVEVSRLGMIQVETGPMTNGGCDLRYHELGEFNNAESSTNGMGYKHIRMAGTRFKTGAEVTLANELQPGVARDFREISDATFFTVVCGGEEQHFSIPPPHANNKVFDHLPVVFIGMDGMGRAHAWRKMPLTMKALARIENAGESGEGPAHVYNFMKHSTQDFATGKNSNNLFRGRFSRSESTTNCPSFWNATTGTVIWSWGMCMKIDERSGEEQTKKYDEDKEDWFQDPYGARVPVEGKPGKVTNFPLDNRPPPDQFVQHTDPWCHPDYWNPGEGQALGLFGGPYGAAIRCIGSRKAHMHHFDVFDPVDPPALTLIWDLTPHEPTGEVVATVDADLANFIENTIDLNTTAVVWTADHGNHVGLYPQTTEGGYVEQSNVMSVLTLPTWYVSEEQHEGLRANEQRLLSHTDLYQTLKDIYDRPLSGAAPPAGAGNGCNPRARSLWEDVGDSDSIEDLDIRNACMCEECNIGGVPRIELDDVFIQKAQIAESVMNQLRSEMTGYDDEILDTLVVDIDPDKSKGSASFF